MKSSSAVIISIVVTTLSVSPLALQGCGSSSTPGVSASGGATTSSLGGSGYLGAGGSAFTGAGGSGTLTTGGASSVPVNPSCVANGTCAGTETCTSGCQNNPTLSFTCTCNNGVYQCDTAACTQPTTCRLDSACAAVGSTCQAMCPAVNGVTSALQYTCTCGMRGAGATGTGTGTSTGTRTFTGFGTGTGTGVGTSTRTRTGTGTSTGTGTGTNNLIYTTCDDATACVPACTGGAQTAGSTCTAADNTCTYTNASGAAVTCTCGGGGARVWTCR